MNPGEPNHPGGQWSGAQQGPPQSGGMPGQQWDPNAQYQYPGGGWGPAPRAPGPRPDLSLIFALASAVAGIVTYFMGFLSWITVSAGADEELDQWGTRLDEGEGGIPGFFSYEIVLNPGKFFIVLGVVAVATSFVLVPRYRRALPFLAVIGVAAWLALFAAALVVPPFLDLGAGAIIGLIFGALQVTLLMAAAFLYGLKKDDAVRG
ncbi:hypothetical protein GDN83_12195 [Gordonia jinghuaiqii]|uniref:DUF5336 domain-containing protein n=1 Tax=Gordonia jinghuaiqii TaxID=2758710 RepID=A0A7D7R1N7_9ACTN|nr:DUF5336 domain-containing protein [Gordonia jinghuaiqii]MCR5978477.1 hypothetical protein [Gordonia jinghuaiqii]QMT02811.1 DUF5336 domain-containing protein [Gordonia jinghuaiqii]